jgi:hypothetical protein
MAAAYDDLMRAGGFHVRADERGYTEAEAVYLGALAYHDRDAGAVPGALRLGVNHYMSPDQADELAAALTAAAARARELLAARAAKKVVP